MITVAEAIRTNAARTMYPFDNLRIVMRDLFYRLVERHGAKPDEITAGLEAMAGYDTVSGQTDPETSTFKGVPVRFDRAMPRDEMRFMHASDVVGVITNIS